MISRIGKVLAVVDELKQMPAEERQWLLDECKEIAAHHKEQYSVMFQQASPSQQLRLVSRIKTLDTVERLLNQIEIRFS